MDENERLSPISYKLKEDLSSYPLTDRLVVRKPIGRECLSGRHHQTLYLIEWTTHIFVIWRYMRINHRSLKVPMT